MGSGNEAGPTIRRRRGKLALCGAVAVLSLTAACGGGDDAAVGPTSTSTTSTASSPTGDVGEYCATVLQIETVPEPDVDFASASEEEIVAAVRQQAQEVYLPLAEDVQASAPNEIADDVDTLVAAVEELATTGDFEATFETPEVAAAEERVHAFDLANCGWEQVDVTAVDYQFQGIADSYQPGAVSFELSNQGGELHELVLLQKNEGVAESFEEILAAGEEEGMQK